MDPAAATRFPLWFDLLLVAGWIVYIPASYLAYLAVKAPQRKIRDAEAMRRLQVRPGYEGFLGIAADVLHEVRNFLWPVAVATTVPLITLLIYLPFTRRWTTPLLQQIWPDFLNLGDSAASLTAVARVVLWGFTGAFLYSFTTLWRRFMTLDITPNAYTYIGIRFLTSILTGGVVGAVLGASIAATGGPVGDRAVVPICATVFMVGLFPDFGLAYLRELARKYLGRAVDSDIEISLLRISGINLWHESRFRQDGIENVHNLASTDLARLIHTFPFTVGQLVDWVDEAILLAHAGTEQTSRLATVGIRHASSVSRAIQDPAVLGHVATATGLSAAVLQVISLSLDGAINLPLILHFRQTASASAEQVVVITAPLAPQTENGDRSLPPPQAPE